MDEKNYLLKSEVKLNRTGMNQIKKNQDLVDEGIQDRLTTTQTKASNRSRASTKQGRTRAQIIAEFFCSQNWNYLAKKSLMVKNEREQFGNAIAKFRRVKRGMRLFVKVYRKWITKIKAQRSEEGESQKPQEVKQETQEEDKHLEEEKIPVPTQEQQKLEEEKIRKAEPDEVLENYSVQKPEFVLSEESDIFSLNEGVDLSKFKESSGVNTDDYADKLKSIKEDKKKLKKEIKTKKLDEIIEEEDESIILSPFQAKAGKVLALKLEKAWERKMERREGKKLRGLLQNLPIQCRNSYVKLMQLRRETADLQDNFTKMPVRY